MSSISEINSVIIFFSSSENHSLMGLKLFSDKNWVNSVTNSEKYKQK